MTRLSGGLAIFACLAFLVLAARADQSVDAPGTQPAATQESNMKTETATFALGCFWVRERWHAWRAKLFHTMMVNCRHV